MAHEFTTSYVKESLAVFRQYKRLTEGAMAQVSEAQLSETLDEESNSIAVIVKHMAGNMRSRWTDFLSSDGEKPDRDRDAEFETTGRESRAEVLKVWEDGWSVALGSIEVLTPADLDRTVHIRGEAFLVIEALNRSVTHAASHVGQIVYLARHFAGAGWTSLTIPKGASKLAKGEFKK